MAVKPTYKVIFLNQGQVYEMYAKQIFQSDLWGFLEVEEFVFGERTQVVVDPSEEKLKAQFDGVVKYDLETGTLVGDRMRIKTPKPATPEAVADVVDQIVRLLVEWERDGREDVALGYLSRIKALVAAEVFSDFVEMGEHLLDAGEVGISVRAHR